MRPDMPLQGIWMGTVPYPIAIEKMQAFNQQRTPSTQDQVWFLQHPSIFTYGRNSDPAHFKTHQPDIDCIASDRGGQITYHGPGQLIVYPLLDLRRLNLTPHAYVHVLEQTVIATLKNWDLEATADPNARGVYIDGAKIASIGLRISRGYSAHGLALNVNMDLSAFTTITPCGLDQIRITQLAHYDPMQLDDVVAPLFAHLATQLGYHQTQLHHLGD